MFQVLTEEVNKIKKYRNHPIQTLLPAKQEPWTAENLTALTNSIRDHGQIKPVIVIKQPDETLVVADGNRRLRVLAQLGIMSVNVIEAENLDELLSLLPTFTGAEEEAQVAYSKRTLQFGGLYRTVISPFADAERRLHQSVNQRGKPRGGGSPPGGAYSPRVVAHFGFSRSRLNSLSMVAGLLEGVPADRRPSPISDVVEDVNWGRCSEDQIYERFAVLGGSAHIREMTVAKFDDDSLIRSLSTMAVLTKFLGEVLFGDLNEVTPEVKARTIRSLADLKRSITIVQKKLKKG